MWRRNWQLIIIIISSIANICLEWEEKVKLVHILKHSHICIKMISFSFHLSSVLSFLAFHFASSTTTTPAKLQIKLHVCIAKTNRTQLLKFRNWRCWYSNCLIVTICDAQNHKQNIVAFSSARKLLTCGIYFSLKLESFRNYNFFLKKILICLQFEIV